MKVATIQMEVKDNDKPANLKKAEKLIEKAAGVDLIILPEMWNCGFFSFDHYAKESEELNGENLTRIAKKARKVKAYILAGSIVERKDGKLYNTSVMLNPRGEIIGIYRKMHLFSYVSLEQKILTLGNEIVAVKTELATFGLAICYDLRFPELFRRLVDRGVEVFLVPSAWPFSTRFEHWFTLNCARALENLAFLVACNCAGRTATGVKYLGRSMMVDPCGIPIAQASFGEEITTANMDIEKVKKIREELPFLKDRVLKI